MSKMSNVGVFWLHKIVLAKKNLTVRVFLLRKIEVGICFKPPRYVPYKCTYVPYNGTFGASDQGQMLDL